MISQTKRLFTLYRYVFRFNEFILSYTSNGSYTKSQLVSHNTSVIGLLLFICMAVISEAPALKKHCEKLKQEASLKNLQYIEIREAQTGKGHTQVHSPDM